MQILEQRQGLRIACVEEIALRSALYRPRPVSHAGATEPRRAATGNIFCPSIALTSFPILNRYRFIIVRFAGSTICVTGGAGFIGSAVVRHLLDNTDAYVVNIDKLTYASNLSFDSSSRRASALRACSDVDICDGPALTLFERYRPMPVMNLAAESHVDRSIDGPGEFIRTNIVGTFTLLQEALRYWRSFPPRADALPLAPCLDG